MYLVLVTRYELRKIPHTEAERWGRASYKRGELGLKDLICELARNLVCIDESICPGRSRIGKKNYIKVRWSKQQGPALTLKILKAILKETKHVAIIGSTGCGKTTLAKLLCSLTQRCIIIDWDGEYADLGCPIFTPPFPMPNVDLKTVISGIERAREGGHGLAASLVLREYFYIGFEYRYEPPLVLDLSCIESVRDRVIVQQALALIIMLSRPLNPLDEILLLIEEGGMRATLEYLKGLFALARRRGVRLLWISQQLPPEELLSNFVLCIGDPGPLRAEWSRRLGLPIPRLGRGEFLIFDGNTVKKVRVKL